MDDIPLPEPDDADAASGDAAPDADATEREAASSRLSLRALAQLMTVVVAVAAIGLSVWEGRETRRHNRLSVLPRLEASSLWLPMRLDTRSALFRNAFADSAAVAYQDSIVLQNNGLGPAVIHRVQVRVADSITYDTERSGWRDQYMFRAVVDRLRRVAPNVATLNVRTYPPGTFLSQGMHPLIQFMVPAGQSVEALIHVRRSLVEPKQEIQVLYCSCSVYGEDCSTTSFWRRDVPDDFTCRPFVPVAD